MEKNSKKKCPPPHAPIPHPMASPAVGEAGPQAAASHSGIRVRKRGRVTRWRHRHREEASVGAGDGGSCEYGGRKRADDRKLIKKRADEKKLSRGMVLCECFECLNGFTKKKDELNFSTQSAEKNRLLPQTTLHSSSILEPGVNCKGEGSPGKKNRRSREINLYL